MSAWLGAVAVGAGVGLASGEIGVAEDVPVEVGTAGVLMEEFIREGRKPGMKVVWAV